MGSPADEGPVTALRLVGVRALDHPSGGSHLNAPPGIERRTSCIPSSRRTGMSSC